MRFLLLLSCPTVVSLCLAGCSPKTNTSAKPALAVPTNYSTQPKTPDSCALALAPHDGKKPIDKEIVRLQKQVRDSKTDPVAFIENLGWKFVEKARLSYDPGYYKLAEAASLCMESKQPGISDALLLRGHVLHSLHKFKEAEVLARKLVAQREVPYDYGLLGDVLMEQGNLKDAVQAYQKMINLKPGLQSYSRGAYVRWLKGNVSGAAQLMKLAAGAGSMRDGNSTAWAYTRLALYEMQGGRKQQAQQACDFALNYQKDYAPALLARGRMLLGEGKNAEAVKLLQRAAALNPLPEYQWLLADALRAAKREPEARAVEAQLTRSGAVDDPRTFSLYLATRGQQPQTALNLAQQELKNRADIFTLDALAWALTSTGKVREARPLMQRALAEGTQDARLFFHAGTIALKGGEKPEARRWLAKANQIRQMLLPSEREQLSRQLAAL